ncbi:MAG: hypothetical protein RLZZ324_850 [Candidatus Parcubacteria bacterium]|jgi:uncharacterized protein YndB with AHSA1/START domain
MSFSSSASVIVHAPLATVWEALTVPEQVKRYFFGTNLDTTWEVGAPVFFRGEWEGKPYEDRGTIIAFEPMKRLSFNYWSAFSGAPDTPETRQVLAYDVTEKDGGVEVRITQSNAPSQEVADHSAGNWKMVLDGMKKMVETGA